MNPIVQMRQDAPAYCGRGAQFALAGHRLTGRGTERQWQEGTDHRGDSRWKSIEGGRISGNGDWVVYEQRPTNTAEAKPTLHILRDWH